MNNFVTPNVVISKCIEFDHCRWNNQMIQSQFVKDLEPYVNFIPVCPEVEIDLGTPREPIRLVYVNGENRLKQSHTEIDYTQQMIDFTDNFFDSLNNIDGFILKDRSPSCGYKDVKVYPRVGKVAPISSKGKGIFGAKAIDTFPHLAIENEGRLNNFRIREHFYTKLFTIARFRKVKEGKSMNDLVQFQSSNKYLFMAYNQQLLRKMGKIVANHEKKPIEAVLDNYQVLFYKLLSEIPKYTSNINVLMHCLGYFSDDLTGEEKEYFLNILEDYRNEKVPLSVCIAIMRAWIIRFDEPYLKKQTFFTPYPKGLIEIKDSGKGRGK